MAKTMELLTLKTSNQQTWNPKTIPATIEALLTEFTLIQDAMPESLTFYEILCRMSEAMRETRPMSPQDLLSYWQMKTSAKPFSVSMNLLRADWSPWGEMRLDYLRETTPEYLNDWILSNKLAIHLIEINQRCSSMMTTLMEKAITTRSISPENFREINNLRTEVKEIIRVQELYQTM